MLRLFRGGRTSWVSGCGCGLEGEGRGQTEYVVGRKKKERETYAKHGSSENRFDCWDSG